MLINSNELLGQTLGTCTLQRLLGRGGMGSVYLAQQSRPRRTVAVKVLLPGILLEQRPRAEFLVRFRREADAVAALDHVNILPVYEYGEQGELAYLVMPYVIGGTLREVLERRGVLPMEEVLLIIEQAASALDCAHAQGIVHRDLKPANMLFHADGRILLADFGLAKVLRDVAQKERESNGQSMLTSAGTIIGTPEYLSPEQGTGNPVDHRADIYSLGIVLYQMLAGRIPFTGSSPVAVAVKHALEAPPAPSQFNPGISAAVQVVVMKAIAKLPDQRFDSAGEFARALRKAATSRSLETPAPRKHSVPEQQDTLTLSTTVDEQKTLPGIPPTEGPGEKEPPAPALEEQEAVSPAVLKPTREEDLAPDIHELPTEASSRLAEKVEKEQVAALPTIIAKADDWPDEARKGKPRLEKKLLEDRVPIATPTKRPPRRAPAPAKSAPVAPVERAPSGPRPQTLRARAGCQSAWMMLMGSLLTLLLLVGGYAAYLHFVPAPSHKTISHTPVSTHKATPAAKTSPSALPSAAVPVGPLLYGTSLPGNSCDTHGGQWSNTPGVKVTCGTSDIQLVNTGSSGTAGILLNQLPGKPMPNDYVIQVQATMHAGSTGAFGVFFRNQPGSSPPNGYTFFINPPDNWGANVYDSSAGGNNALVTRPLINPVSGTITIDVVVQGTTFTFYVNGTQEGYAASERYTGGTIGLAVSEGANVSFKNLAVYALPGAA